MDPLVTAILDHVAQGFAIVDLDGKLAPECSRALARWFGPTTGRPDVWSYLFTDVELEAWTMMGFASLRAGVLPAEVVLAQLPVRTERGGLHFRIEYRPILSPENAMTSILIAVTDVTAELERSHSERAYRDLVAVMEKAGADRAGVAEFVRDSNALVALCVDPELPLDNIRRSIHTLKGNAGLFGVASVSEVCHALELRILEQAVAPDPTERAELSDTWSAFRTLATRIFELDRRLVVVDRSEFDRVVAELGPAGHRIRSWCQDDARTHLERFAEQARQLAQRLARAPLEIQIEANDCFLEAGELSALWSALAHVVRNAVDHGVETSAQRQAAGKSAHAQLVLRAELVGESFSVEVADDGPGIDWVALAARSRALGLAVEGPEAVFALGVSTASRLGEVSGAGIGMGAVRATCRGLGGRVELASTPGQGTRVRCIVPVASRLSSEHRI